MAVNYPDGHPSEEEMIFQVPKEDEQKLRRFVCLGRILEGTREENQKTGHVLVVDVEPGRNLRPWIVLASESLDGEEWITVAPSVTRNNPEERWGMLPGDTNRTPVGKIISMDTPRTSSILGLFGLNFNFTVVRKGSSRLYDRRTRQGPGLPRVMYWYPDPKSNDQVCYLENPVEYMRFHPGSQTITYCKRAGESFAGEQGL